MLLSNDIIDKILLITESKYTICGFRFARIDVRRRKIFDQKSTDARLSKRGSALRFLREHIDKLRWINVSENTFDG